MSAAPASLASWLVSAHPRGEVLTIEERGPSLTLWLLGQPEGFSVPEVQGWLHDVSGVAHESASQDTSPQPIPVLLRHALSGLLFSHSEMWSHGEGPGPCSVAFTTGEDGIGIGWIGDAEVSVLLDNQTCDVRWVLVRDDHGREARAWSVEPGRDVRVTLRWQLRPGDADSPRVLLEARTRAGAFASEPSAVVAAPKFVPPASRRTAVAESPVPEPVVPEPVIEPIPLTGPSVDALYEAESLQETAAVPESIAPEVAAAPEAGDFEFIPQAEATLTIEPRTYEPPAISPPAIAEAPPSIADVPPASAQPPMSEPEPVVAAPVAPMPKPAPDLDPARPSSGIARWLSKNFAWIRPRAKPAEHEAPAVRPAPAVPEPIAEQQEMAELVAPPPLPEVVEESPARDESDAALELGPVIDLEPRIDAGSPVAPAAIEPFEIVNVERQHEDELARTAAALAAALSGWEAKPASDTPRPAPIEVVAEPSRIFDVLPEQIPPTPEAEEITAQASAPEIDPGPIELTDAMPLETPVAPAPPIAAAPPRLPSFVRAPVERAELESPIGFDPHERSFGPLETEPVVEASLPPAQEPEPEAGPKPTDAMELETPIAAASATRMADDAPAVPVATVTEPAVEAAMQPEAMPADVALPPRRRAALHPDWPAENEVQNDMGPRTRATWIALGAVIAVLFGVGWLVGSLQGGRHGAAAPTAGKGPLGFLGIKGPTFKTEVKSQPDGAWILVDGTPLQKRTPMTIDLPPGKHEITLSFGQWGQAVYPVEGRKDQTMHVDGTLWGSLEVGTPELGVVIAVAIDGRPRGFAPVVIDSLAPGPHQVRFSGPGMPSWGQTVEIHVAQRQQVLARTVRSPATGMLQVRANRTEAGESEPFSGAKVWIDGEPRGVTPLTLELARGPHSVRVELGDDRPPVQMIDLPGGNQRFATFELGTGEDHPVVRLDAPARVDAERPSVVSATITEVAPRDVREMWLHVQGPDGTWSRYPMARLQGQLSPVGAVAFPVTQIGAAGRTSWYVSAVTTQGDEFFSEVQSMAKR